MSELKVNPLAVAAAAATKPTILGYRLRAGCSTYVFRDGTVVTANGGVITSWLPSQEAELVRNARDGAMTAITSTEELRASVAVIVGGI